MMYFLEYNNTITSKFNIIRQRTSNIRDALSKHKIKIIFKEIRFNLIIKKKK